jgi:YHS domain-containing protein
MFVDVEFPLKPAAGIYIPRDALVDSGARKIVYIETGAGAFEPRDVETGSTFGDRVQITGGLAEGERVVTAGTFLVDSESRMHRTAPVQTAVARSSATAVDPVCGMEVEVASAHKLSRGGKTYFFCSEDCKAEYARKMVR